MGLRFGLIVSLLLVISAEADSSSFLLYSDVAGIDVGGLVGECLDPSEEVLMSSEAARRALAQGPRFISYGAIRRDRIPCSRRGHSYYNCDGRGSQANPYRRGCSAITHCARYTG